MLLAHVPGVREKALRVQRRFGDWVRDVGVDLGSAAFSKLCERLLTQRGSMGVFLFLTACTIVGTLLLYKDGLRKRGRGSGQGVHGGDEPARVHEMAVVHVVHVK